MTSIVITGASGFLGSHLMRHLADYHPYGVTSKAYDLRREAHIDALFKHAQPDIIFHLAANVGGIQYNLDNAGSLFYDNVMMNTQLIHKSLLNGVSKFIMVGTVCSYPAFPPLPTNEAQFWTGYPEPSNGAYGISKLVALEQLQAYQRQYSFNFAYPVLSNLYGPGEQFNERKSHVIPALIKRFLTKPEVMTIWGDGTPTRDFLYVEDACQALSRFIEVDCPEPINIAGGQEISIKSIVNLLANMTGFEGKIEYDTSKPNGQLRRAYDISKAKKVLNWQPTTKFEDGLKRTVHANYHNDQR